MARRGCQPILHFGHTVRAAGEHEPLRSQDNHDKQSWLLQGDHQQENDATEGLAAQLSSTLSQCRLADHDACVLAPQPVCPLTRHGSLSVCIISGAATRRSSGDCRMSEARERLPRLDGRSRSARSI